MRSKLCRHQYTIYDREFCGSEVCVDFDNDGRRELLYASRAPGKLRMLDAADGRVLWCGELRFAVETPVGTQVRVDVVDSQGRPLREGVASDTDLRIREPVRLTFHLTTSEPAATPKLDSYSLKFDRFGR